MKKQIRKAQKARARSVKIGRKRRFDKVKMKLRAQREASEG